MTGRFGSAGPEPTNATSVSGCGRRVQSDRCQRNALHDFTCRFRGPAEAVPVAPTPAGADGRQHGSGLRLLCPAVRGRIICAYHGGGGRGIPPGRVACVCGGGEGLQAGRHPGETLLVDGVLGLRPPAAAFRHAACCGGCWTGEWDFVGSMRHPGSGLPLPQSGSRLRAVQGAVAALTIANTGPRSAILPDDEVGGGRAFP